jgi:hypothetical protein
MRFKNFYFVAVLLLTACLSFTSCGKDETDPVKDVTLNVTGFSENAVAFTASEISITVELSDQNTDWRVKSSESWLTCDPMRGTGSGSFKAKVAANSDETERTATVTVYLTDKETVKKEFIVKQQPYSANFDFEDSGLFSDKAVAVHYFWSEWNAEQYAKATPALYYYYNLKKPGKLTISLTKSLHIFLHSGKPKMAPITMWSDKTVPLAEQIGDFDDGDTAFATVYTEDGSGEDSKKSYTDAGGGDVIKGTGEGTWDLPAGEYWTTHTSEGEVEPNKINYTYKATFRAK